MFFRGFSVVGYAYDHETGDTDLLPAMSFFDTRFLYQDHHLKNLVMAGRVQNPDGTFVPNRLIFTLGDANSDLVEEYEDQNHHKYGYANFHESLYLGEPGLRSLTGRGNGTDKVRVAVPPPGPDHLIVLSGFGFRGKAETDHHVRALGIRYLPATSEFEVEYRDNSPDDDAFTFEIHYLVLRKNLDFPANFTLDDAHTQRINFTKEATVPKELPGYALISGFHFRFIDNDHHIRAIGVNVQERDQLYVAFFDDEEDNPVEAIVDYVRINVTD